MGVVAEGVTVEVVAGAEVVTVEVAEEGVTVGAAEEEDMEGANKTQIMTIWGHPDMTEVGVQFGRAMEVPEEEEEVVMAVVDNKGMELLEEVTTTKVMAAPEVVMEVTLEEVEAMEVQITPVGVSLEGVEVMELLEVVMDHPEVVMDLLEVVMDPLEVVMDHLEAVMDHSLEETADVINHISVQTSLLEKGMNLNLPSKITFSYYLTNQ